MSLFSSGVFVMMVLLAEVLGVTVVVLMFAFVNRIGGLGLDVKEDSKVFNLHPFLMTLGFGFLYGNAILVFKAGAATGISKFTLKLIHFSLQLVTFILAVLGLFAVFRYHRVHGYPNMMSLHNWIGMATVVFFGLQLLFGFLFFLFPRPRESIRATYKSVHVFFGFFIFAMVTVSILTGLTEQVMYSGGFDDFKPKVLIANIFGVVLVAFVGVVTFIATSPLFIDTDEMNRDLGEALPDEKAGLLEMKEAAEAKTFGSAHHAKPSEY